MAQVGLYGLVLQHSQSLVYCFVLLRILITLPLAYDSMKGPHIEYKFVFGAGRDQSWSGIGPRE